MKANGSEKLPEAVASSSRSKGPTKVPRTLEGVSGPGIYGGQPEPGLSVGDTNC